MLASGYLSFKSLIELIASTRSLLISIESADEIVWSSVTISLALYIVSPSDELAMAHSKENRSESSMR